MLLVLFYLLLYCIFSSLSFALLGDRNLISGNLFSVNKILILLTHWKFITAMILSVGARLTFTLINSTLLNIPSLSKNSTTISICIASLSYLFIFVTNFFLLNERLNLQQFFGASLIIIGIIIILK